MPNDVPDWTTLNQVNLIGGLSGKVQGDVSSATLQIDSVTETLGGTAGFGGSGLIAIASFKAASGSTIALVGALGTLVVGTSTSVSPTFGQAPTAGNLLVAWVTGASGSATTGQAGWVQAIDAIGNGQDCAVWYKPNAAGGDAAPTFTLANGSNLMSAQLAEFSGAATVSPLDRTGSAQYQVNPVAVAAGGADVAFGDLVLTVSRVIEAQAGTAIFTDTINNGGTPVQAGSAQVGSIAFRACNFTYTIIPVAAVAQPLGVATWAYDATGFSTPGAGVAASAVLAATPGKTYTAAYLGATALTNAAVVLSQTVKLLDGATQLTAFLMAAPGTPYTMAPPIQGPVAYRGSVGNSMTWQFDGAPANSQESVNIGAYLR